MSKVIAPVVGILIAIVAASANAKDFYPLIVPGGYPASCSSPNFTLTTNDSILLDNSKYRMNTRYTLAGVTSTHVGGTYTSNSDFSGMTGMTGTPWTKSTNATYNQSSGFQLNGCEGSSFINTFTIDPSYVSAATQAGGGPQTFYGVAFATPIDGFDATSDADLVLQANVRNPQFYSNNAASPSNGSGFVASIAWYVPSFIDSYCCRFEAAASNSTGLTPPR